MSSSWRPGTMPAYPWMFATRALSIQVQTAAHRSFSPVRGCPRRSPGSSTNDGLPPERLALVRVVRCWGPPVRPNLVELGRRQRVIPGGEGFQVVSRLPLVEHAGFQPLHADNFRQKNLRIGDVRAAKLAEPCTHGMRILKQTKALVEGTPLALLDDAALW